MSEQGNALPRPTGLGPKQVIWLRQNVKPFAELEDIKLQVRQDVRRAAERAGLLKEEA